MISFQPSTQIARQAIRRALGATTDRFESMAVERWTIAPAVHRRVQPAAFLDGQLDKIRDTEFATVDDLARVFKGDFECVEPATEGLRFRHVDLVDGVLYAGGEVRHLRARQRRRPAYVRPRESISGAMYESWTGNRWFGTWLMDDCLTYELAQRWGTPVTTAPKPLRGHSPRYERLLGIEPQRVTDAHFDELVLFRDAPNNEAKRERALRYREKLLDGRPAVEHAGVFLVRGRSGDRRVLLNEMLIAERLAARYGYRIIDPLRHTVDEVVDACAGARVVAGVEGSHLVHGLMAMSPQATLFVVQPPFRAVSILKSATDRQGQGFAFVVGDGGREEFSVDVDDVERTLDLVQR